jgi:hypothetical protein
MPKNISTDRRALYAFLAIILAAGWLYYYYVLSQKKEPERTQDEKQYTFKCDKGHFFSGLGRKAPRPCIEKDCTADAYLYLLFACRNHHKTGILLRTNPDEYKFDGSTSSIGWRAFNIDELVKERCPTCSTPGLMPAVESPAMEK